MPANLLPNHYTYRDIIGVTSGRELPTVYFNDGSHFTQCHGHQNNIGHHPPCTHLYFGNVNNPIITAARTQAIQDLQLQNIALTGQRVYIATCQELAARLNVQVQNLNNPQGVPLVAPLVAQPNHHLFEVTFNNATGNVRYHISGGYIQDRSDFRKMALMIDLRARTAIKEQNAQTGNWRFRAAPALVPA